MTQEQSEASRKERMLSEHEQQRIRKELMEHIQTLVQAMPTGNRVLIEFASRRLQGYLDQYEMVKK